jgi:hypothetical protein
MEFLLSKFSSDEIPALSAPVEKIEGVDKYGKWHQPCSLQRYSPLVNLRRRARASECQCSATIGRAVLLCAMRVLWGASKWFPLRSPCIASMLRLIVDCAGTHHTHTHTHTYR